MNLRSYFLPLLDRFSNIDFVIIKICKELNIQIQPGFVQVQTSEHPDYPSMLTIADVLKSLNIESISIKTSINQIENLSFPAIAQLEIKNKKYFTVFTEINNNHITYFDPIFKISKKVKMSELDGIFTGYIMLVESDKILVENNSNKINAESKNKNLQDLFRILLPFLILLYCFISFAKIGLTFLPEFIYFIITLIGVGISILMLWYEIDQYNPAFRLICGQSKRTNCGAIMHSKGSRILGVKWSNIGFVYFIGTILFFLFMGYYNQQKMLFLFWLNLFSILFIPYSLIYQYKIVKQWCNLCLLTLITLSIQFVVLYFGIIYKANFLLTISFETFFTAAFSFYIPIIFLYFIVPELMKNKENKSIKRQMTKLKLDYSVFNVLLEQEKQVQEPKSGLGITLGNPNALIKIIKVCSPYCNPCAISHMQLENLLEKNNNISLQIIYNSSINDDDRSSKPVKHFLSIASKDNENFTKQVLDEWYQNDDKNYQEFAEKFKINSADLESNNENIIAMKEWCENAEIFSTPTLFINGKKLPNIYSINDLQYFLAV